MNRISIFLLFTFVYCGFCHGQSTAIQTSQPRVHQGIQRQVFRSNTLSRSRLFNDWPISSMSSEMRRWEAILDRPTQVISENAQTVGALVTKLRTLGLPVVLTLSAKEDYLFENEEIVLPLPSLPLRDRLVHALSEMNGCITMCNGLIKIISKDDNLNEDLAMTVTYDVTDLGVDYDDLANHLQNVIDVDSWQDNGGLGMISPMTVGDRHLISITQNYGAQRKVKSLLSESMRLGTE